MGEIKTGVVFGETYITRQDTNPTLVPIGIDWWCEDCGLNGTKYYGTPGKPVPELCPKCNQEEDDE